ncbi:hypothetical protein LPJ53_000319 [Coemansia erecta]|uniref:Zn(2)-C6 fungal-type domain-containing protein n=1 Tax=Coemansia erecta TaxID=147472 RepID=A0A9W7Y260_9FUNG|nr:hypothetical protein LPJ53_000319 [Coemansia erecta]
MAGTNSTQMQLSAAIPLLKSCESCRQRKIKCSGDKPTCAHCARRHQPCIYRRSARYKRRPNRDGTGESAGPESDPVAAKGARNGAAAAAAAKAAALNGGTKAKGSANTQTGSQRMRVSSPEEMSVDENVPLSTLFSTRPMNEADILPPSILQSMNFWMNDSMLTGATTAATGLESNGFGGIPAQAPLPSGMMPVGSNGLQFPQNLQVQSQAQAQQMQSQTGVQDLDILRNLIPMDIALGLPAFSPSQIGQPQATSMPMQQQKQPGGIDGLAGIQQQSGGVYPSLGFSAEMMQQFSQQLSALQIPPVGSTYADMNLATPLSAGSPNPVFGPPTAPAADMNTAMMSMPTSAFASLNLVSSLDLQRSVQQGLPSIQRTPLQVSIGNELGTIMTNPLLSPTMPGVANNGVGMHPVPTSATAAAAAGFAESAVPASFRPNMTLQRNNSMPVSPGTLYQPQGMSASATLPASMSAQQQKQQYMALSSPMSASASHENSGNLLHRGQQQQQQHAVDSPLSLSMLQGGSQYQQQAESSATSAGSLSPGPSVTQINDAAIPQAIRDIVAEHPEMGSPELIYNLLITHVVHDCSRVGIYAARLFWMRVKQYKLPRFFLLAAIADACRSWTQSDAQRAAMPANLDETCYALSMQCVFAEIEATGVTVLNALGMLTLALYEFKSARFASMVEHGCLAYKLIMQMKIRGAPFPWRGAVRQADASGLDSNYQLLLRAFWRIYMGLFYGSEIFRLDLPEDRDFMPELPERDDEFVRNVFEPEDNTEFGFRMVAPPYTVTDSGRGDLLGIVCELHVRQYKIANLFNRVMRGEKTPLAYITYLREWDRQMLEWRRALPAYLRDDLPALAQRTQPLDARCRRMNLCGLSEDAMWRRRHQWNAAVGSVMEILYVHMLFETARIKAHRIGLMILLGEDLDMVRNFQNSRAYAVHELPPSNAPPILATYEDDADCFRKSAAAADAAATHVYALLKFSYQFGFDLHAYTTVIIATLLQVGLVYVGQVQSSDARVAWHAMLRLARILGMVRSLDRWGPALYIFTNILKALGRPDLILHMPSPETRARLAADTRRPEGGGAAEDDEQPGAKRKSGNDANMHGDEKRYEFDDHHHGTPQSSTPGASMDSPSISEDEDVTNPFPPDHVISHIMREQKVSTATFFSPTLPILAASLLHSNSGPSTS